MRLEGRSCGRLCSNWDQSYETRFCVVLLQSQRLRSYCRLEVWRGNCCDSVDAEVMRKCPVTRFSVDKAKCWRKNSSKSVVSWSGLSKASTDALRTRSVGTVMYGSWKEVE